MRIASLALTVTALSMLTACAGLTSERYHGKIIEARPEAMRHCTFLGSVSSSSGLTGLFAPKGVDNIHQKLLKQADAMGATHIVWDKPVAGLEDTSASGKAYECPPATH
jgi:hypothetical protein